MVLLLAGSLTAVVGAGRVWLSVELQDPVLGTTAALVTGSAVTGTVTAAGLLAAAATLVSLLTRGAVRGTGLVLALIAGGWLLWIGLSVAVDPTAAARSASRPGGAGSPGTLLGPESVSLTAAGTTADATVWPWIVAAAGLVTMCGVVAAVLSGRRTDRAADALASDVSAAPAASHRTVLRGRPAGQDSPGEPAGPDASARAWEELSAGRDPTEDPDRTDESDSTPEPP